MEKSSFSLIASISEKSANIEYTLLNGKKPLLIDFKILFVLHLFWAFFSTSSTISGQKCADAWPLYKAINHVGRLACHDKIQAFYSFSPPIWPLPSVLPTLNSKNLERYSGLKIS